MYFASSSCVRSWFFFDQLGRYCCYFLFANNILCSRDRMVLWIYFRFIWIFVIPFSLMVRYLYLFIQVFFVLHLSPMMMRFFHIFLRMMMRLFHLCFRMLIQIFSQNCNSQSNEVKWNSKSCSKSFLHLIWLKENTLKKITLVVVLGNET